MKHFNIFTMRKVSIILRLLPVLYLALNCTTVNAQASAQTYSWGQAMGGNSPDFGQDVAVDDSGNVYVTGYFNRTADFDRGPAVANLVANGFYADIFIAKYDATGKYVWAKGIGGSSDDYSYGIDVDDSGNVYITGYFQDAVDFDPGPGVNTLTSTAGQDVFLAKYDLNGNHKWAISLGGSSVAGSNCVIFGEKVAVDDSGNAYVTGYFNDIADFDAGPGVDTLRPVAGFDVYVAKYDLNGNHVWAKRIGGDGPDPSRAYDYGKDIAVDGSGNVYVTGYFNSEKSDYDPGPGVDTLSSKGEYDIFVAKYDLNGNHVWAKSMGGNGTGYGYGVAVDGSGNVYVTGSLAGTADFDPAVGVDNLFSKGVYDPSIGVYDYDIFLAKYGPSGNYIWAKSMGCPSNTGYDQGFGVAVDRVSNVYITGAFFDTVDFNPGTGLDTLRVTGMTDAYVAKYDKNGNYIWAGNMGSTGDDDGHSVVVDGFGNVYVAGSYGFLGGLTGDLNPGLGIDTVKRTRSSYDVFVLKMSCSDTSLSHDSISTCVASYVLGNKIYTVAGTYTQVLANISGCDSTVTFDLTFYQLNPLINVNGFTLGVTGTYATYQWFKDGTIMPGATNPTYTVTANGVYKVAVTNGNGCSDTSDIHTITNVGIKAVSGISDQISVYPNPANELVYIQSPVSINADLIGMDGRIIREVKDVHTISLNAVADGIYLLRIKGQDGALIKTEKIIKHGK